MRALHADRAAALDPDTIDDDDLSDAVPQGLHAQLLGDPRVGSVALHQLADDVAHGIDPVLTARAVVPDRRRDPVVAAGAVRAERGDRQVLAGRVTHRLRTAADLAPVEAVDGLAAVALKPRHDRLRVAVGRDRCHSSIARLICVLTVV